MGKTIEKIRMWNIFDDEKIQRGEAKPLELDAQIDNGATDVVLPERLVDELRLFRRGKVRVKYANGKIEEKELCHGVMIEILGRTNVWSAIVEPYIDKPLIGQVVLEALDLRIDSKNGRIMTNPLSPETPLLEIL